MKILKELIKLFDFDNDEDYSDIDLFDIGDLDCNYFV